MAMTNSQGAVGSGRGKSRLGYSESAPGRAKNCKVPTQLAEPVWGLRMYDVRVSGEVAATFALAAHRSGDVIDAMRECFDVARVDAGHHRDAHLVAAKLAITTGVEDAVGAQDSNDGVCID